MGLLSTFSAASGRAFGFTRSAIAAATDAFFNRVTLLLPGNGTNGAQNNTFLDSSSNNFTITRNGNTTQGTFSPFSQTGWSGYFDGNGDYLTLANSSNFSCSGNFTIEIFAYPTAISNTPVIFDTRTAAGNTASIYLYINTSGNIVAVVGGTSITSSSTYTVNSWYYIAIVRSSNSVTLYVNGTSAGTATISTNLSDTGMTIGAPIDQRGATTTNKFTGYLSNFRFNNTTARTISSTPTSALSSDSGTTLLTLQSNRFVDNASSATITIAGETSIQAFSPFAPTAAYSAATNGGSGYFDGAGDYLTLADSTAWDLTGDYTIEFWVYPITTTFGLFGLGSYLSSNNGMTIYYNTNKLELYVNGAAVLTGSSTVVKNQWNHIAVVRSGSSTNNTKLYLNGAQDGQGTNTTSFTGVAGNGVSINNDYASSYSANTGNCYISGLRILKGTAQYTAAFTPPTAPPTAITNTQLLCNFTNAGITDATAKNDLETVGNAQISTTQSKFGGSSMYFDGNGDNLRFQNGPNQNFAFGTGDFTIEGWIYLNASTYQDLLDIYDGNSSGRFLFSVNTSRQLVFSGASGALRTSTSSSVPLSTWTHFAICRASGSTRIFIGGTQGNTTLSDTTNYTCTTGVVVMGINGSDLASNPLNAYVDDLRISKYARYTTTFTPPTAAFALQ